MLSYEEMLEEAYSRIRVAGKDERFEIPQVESVIQGAFTIVRNFSQIADYLRRDAKHMLKFFARELAAPGTLEGGKAIFQTRVSQKTIQQKLEEYVKEFVLCKECKRPDTKLIKEDRIVVMKCEACGAKCPVKQLK
jgi:translation initiation factor 2 subunit 2